MTSHTPSEQAESLRKAGNALSDAAMALARLCGAPGAAFVLRGLADKIETGELRETMQ